MNAPVQAIPNQGKALIHNKQHKKHLLCECCEGKFSKFGEDTICKELKKHNTFMLREKLGSLSSTENISNIESLGIDYLSYAYFALSIIWRGSITRWNPDVDDIYDTLGDFEEPIRNYLLYRKEFPENVYIRIYINTNDIYATGFGFPDRTVKILSKKKVVFYRFNAPGTLFQVMLRKKFKGRARAKYSVYSVPVSFEKKDFGNWSIYTEILTSILEQKRVGRLAKMYE